MSTTTAAAGDEIRIEIHDHFIAPRKDLYMVLASAWEEAKTCGEIPGAIKVGVVEWTDLHELVSVGVATFTVPAVTDGEYRLGEDVGPNEIPPCASAGSLTVTAAVGASTAPHVPDAGSAPISRTWFVIVGLAAFTVAAFFWRRKPR